METFVCFPAYSPWLGRESAEPDRYSFPPSRWRIICAAEIARSRGLELRAIGDSPTEGLPGCEIARAGRLPKHTDPPPGVGAKKIPLPSSEITLAISEANALLPARMFNGNSRRAIGAHFSFDDRLRPVINAAMASMHIKAPKGGVSGANALGAPLEGCLRVGRVQRDREAWAATTQHLRPSSSTLRGLFGSSCRWKPVR